MMVETEGGLANKSRGGALLAGKPGPGSLKGGGEAQGSPAGVGS